MRKAPPGRCLHRSLICGKSRGRVEEGCAAEVCTLVTMDRRDSDTGVTRRKKDRHESTKFGDGSALFSVSAAAPSVAGPETCMRTGFSLGARTRPPRPPARLAVGSGSLYTSDNKSPGY